MSAADDWLKEYELIYSYVPNYLRTLPLHTSQKEIEHTDEYTVFTYDIRPTVDFILELMSYTEGLEVLEPIELRNKIRETLQASLKRYSLPPT
ncbi:MAG: WYL domain-containing protein [Prevotella sp.]|nr:WYL domain-containing protein [Prevotella sp.]